MMISLTTNQNPTMSSREIAELTGKRHDHVMRDIRVMLVELHGERGLPNFGDTQHNEQNGQAYPIYRLPRHETLVLISGYSVQIRSKIIARWDELEQRNRQPLDILENPEAMRGLLLTYTEKVLELEPKAKALDRIATASDGSLTITAAAKVLQMHPKALFEKLKSQKWIYKRGRWNRYLGYQARIDAGLVEHKVDVVRLSSGHERVIQQVLVTAKGMARLSVA